MNNTQEFMECATCRGGNDPRYSLSPCPNCWGSRKLPHLPQLGRRRIPAFIFRWLRRGVSRCSTRTSVAASDLAEKGAFEPIHDGSAEHEQRTRRPHAR